MANVAVLIDNDFEDSEYIKPAEALKQNGHTLTHLGIKKGHVHGKKSNTNVMIDTEVKEAVAKNFDALLIPGGYSPDNLRAHKEAVDFVKQFFLLQKPIFAICHGPQILISADVLKGLHVTGYRSIKKDIENSGAMFIDKELVIDKNLITSRTPDDLPAFCDEIIRQLKH